MTGPDVSGSALPPGTSPHFPRTKPTTGPMGWARPACSHKTQMPRHTRIHMETQARRVNAAYIAPWRWEVPCGLSYHTAFQLLETSHLLPFTGHRADGNETHTCFVFALIPRPSSPLGPLGHALLLSDPLPLSAFLISPQVPGSFILASPVVGVRRSWAWHSQPLFPSPPPKKRWVRVAAVRDKGNLPSSPRGYPTLGNSGRGGKNEPGWADPSCNTSLLLGDSPV